MPTCAVEGEEQVTLDLGKAIRLSETLATGLSDLGRGLGAIADELESGVLSSADAVMHLRMLATELKDIAGSV